MSARVGVGVPAPAPNELRRERLLEVLHRHCTRALILLVAPAGFGKSTLAAAYARDSGGVMVWLSLQPADRDSIRLFTQLADTFESAFGEQCVPNLRQGLAEGAAGVGLARLLLLDLERAPAAFILVLDDFHVVDDADEVLQSIDTLLRGLPEYGQIVITARRPPALSMIRLVADGNVFGLGIEDLRFTSEETQALRKMLGGDATHDDQAEGWVMGIRLGGAPSQLGAVGGFSLDPYLDSEVLNHLRPTQRRWLESLAILETITPPSAERLLGKGAWPARLRQLADTFAFLSPRQGGEYRLHALMREALMNRFRRTRAGRATRYWTVARQIAEENMDPVGVVFACQELGQIEGAVELVRRSAEEAVRTGRWPTVLVRLQLLPESVRRARPDLSLMEARAQLNSGRTKDHIRLATEAAQAALDHGGRTGDVAVQIAAIIERATIAWASGQMAEAEDLASAADHLLHKHQLSQQTERLLEGRMLGVRGICAESRGDIHAAREFFAMGERLLRLVGPSRDLALIQQNFGSFCNRTGDSATAQKLLAEAAAHWRLLQDRNGLATTENILGDLHLRLGNLEAAGAALKDALEAARAVGSVRIEGWTVVTLGQWHRASGRIRDAVECFDEGLHLAQDSDRELEVAAHVQRAEVALLQDEPETARTLLTQAQAAAQMLRSATAVASVERALGRLHLYEGGGTRAVQFFEAALQRAADTWDAHERAQTLYWLGTAHLHLRQMQTAGARLGEAVDIVERTGLASILGWPAAEDPRLLEYGLKLGLNPPVLREVERLSNLCQPWSGVRQAPLQVVAENPLPRLEVQLFGAFVLHRDGQLVDTGPRKIARARELLALLVLHPKGLADDLITDYMWPGMSPQSAQHNLHVAASNLRRVELQAKAAVRYSAGTYQLHPQLELVADVRAFDAALARGRGATGDQLVAELSKAVEIYRGDLLEDVNWRWVEPFRQAYRARFVGAALQLADLVAWVDARQSDALAERVLAVAPEMDVAYERLIQNARGRGDSMALQRLTRRYQQAAEQFAFTPDPRLVAGLGRHA